MSFVALNNPILVAAGGIGGCAILPVLDNMVRHGSISWAALKTANVLSYAINVIAVSRPGRIDGQAQQDSVKSGSKGGEEMESLSPGRNGRTLVAPSGWAFAIWGPIFLGELVFVVSQVFIPETAPIAPLIKKVTAPFVMAQYFQTLWTAAFRPKYSGNLMFISTGMLGATAYSLSKAHAHIVATPKSYSPLQYILYFLPIALHFGWTSAATLVNLNGAISMKELSSSAKLVRWVGHVSVLTASALGIYISVNRSAPVYGGVIMWALSAVADGMKQRVKNTEKEDPERVGVFGALMQKQLSSLGALTCGAASLFASISLYVLKSRNNESVTP
mmetsp:Transcript_25413/g.37525  ORF Transcript_25413/g.37525 Transcript_25413/m.37525 type:complete len:332 (+) Transcript_25413:114-1109(+)